MKGMTKQATTSATKEIQLWVARSPRDESVSPAHGGQAMGIAAMACRIIQYQACSR